MRKLFEIIFYVWAGIMATVIIVAIVKVIFGTDYAWIGLVLALIVLFLTRNINLITLYKSKKPK